MTITNYGRQFTENRHIMTDHSTNHLSTLLLKKQGLIRTLKRRAQLVCDSESGESPDSRTKSSTQRTFSTRTITAGTLLDTTPTETLNRTLRTLTRHLSLLQPHLTSKGLLKLSHRCYNPTTPARCSQTYHYFTKTTDER